MPERMSIFGNNPRLLVAVATRSLSFSYGIACENAKFGYTFVKGWTQIRPVQIEVENPF